MPAVHSSRPCPVVSIPDGNIVIVPWSGATVEPQLSGANVELRLSRATGAVPAEVRVQGKPQWSLSAAPKCRGWPGGFSGDAACLTMSLVNRNQRPCHSTRDVSIYQGAGEPSVSLNQSQEGSRTRRYRKGCTAQSRWGFQARSDQDDNNQPNAVQARGGRPR